MSAHAVIKINATRPGNFTSAAASVALPLNTGGATVLTFNHSTAKKFILTFSAECSVGGPVVAWTDLQVRVNGVDVSPTAGNEDAFCSGNGTATSNDGWTRASITVVIQGIVGNNTVQILARQNNGGNGIWIGDSALVVHD
jgi:hypothetical protein